MRTAISALALAFVLFIGVRPAQAFFGAVGWLGYGYAFQEGDDSAFGPTVEVGGSYSLVIASFDLTYWNDLDEAGDSSQLRLGARVKPPLFPLYGRLALGVPLDSAVRDAAGTDVVIGAGVEAFSVALVKLNVELDYHYFTEGSEVHPLELKVGVVIGF